MAVTISPGTNGSLHLPDVDDALILPGIISDRVLEVMTFLNFGVLTSIVVMFGTVANIINAVIYFKMGFKESINISLQFLAISDLGCCLSLFMFAVCYNPLVRNMDLSFDPDDIIYFPGCLSNMFSRITSLTTALITVERCLCVVAPLRVKQILQPKRVSVCLGCITIFVMASIAPHFYTARHQYRFSSEKNSTILTLVFIDDRENIDNKLFIIHSIFIPVSSLCIVLISTVFLVVTLRRQSKWRESVTNCRSSNSKKSSNSLSNRDTKISRMVLLIAAVFIASSLPVTISYTATLFEKEYYLKRRYHNLFHLMFSFHFVLQATNSCLNIFIYYSMSSAYTAIFHRLFGIKKTHQSGVCTH